MTCHQYKSKDYRQNCLHGKTLEKKQKIPFKSICDIIKHVYQLLQIETYSELSELCNDRLKD